MIHASLETADHRQHHNFHHQVLYVRPQTFHATKRISLLPFSADASSRQPLPFASGEFPPRAAGSRVDSAHYTSGDALSPREPAPTYQRVRHRHAFIRSYFLLHVETGKEQRDVRRIAEETGERERVKEREGNECQRRTGLKGGREREIRRRRRRRQRSGGQERESYIIRWGRSTHRLYTCDTYAGKAMGKVYGERGGRRGGWSSLAPSRAPTKGPPDLRSRAKSVGGGRGGARSTLSQYTVSPCNTERGIASECGIFRI